MVAKHCLCRICTQVPTVQTPPVVSTDIVPETTLGPWQEVSMFSSHENGSMWHVISAATEQRTQGCHCQRITVSISTNDPSKKNVFSCGAIQFQIELFWGIPNWGFSACWITSPQAAQLPNARIMSHGRQLTHAWTLSGQLVHATCWVKQKGCFQTSSATLKKHQHFWQITKRHNNMVLSFEVRRHHKHCWANRLICFCIVKETVFTMMSTKSSHFALDSFSLGRCFYWIEILIHCFLKTQFATCVEKNMLCWHFEHFALKCCIWNFPNLIMLADKSMHEDNLFMPFWWIKPKWHSRRQTFVFCGVIGDKEINKCLLLIENKVVLGSFTIMQWLSCWCTMHEVLNWKKHNLFNFSFPSPQQSLTFTGKAVNDPMVFSLEKEANKQLENVIIRLKHFSLCQTKSHLCSGNFQKDMGRWWKLERHVHQNCSFNTTLLEPECRGWWLQRCTSFDSTWNQCACRQDANQTCHNCWLCDPRATPLSMFRARVCHGERGNMCSAVCTAAPSNTTPFLFLMHFKYYVVVIASRSLVVRSS